MTRLTPVERDVCAAIDEEAIVDDLRALVAIASVDGTPEELDAQRWCAERLSSLGADVDSWEIDVAEVARDPDFPGMEVARDRALGCVGVFGANTGTTPALALYGHTDVVPPGDLDRWPGRDPFAMRVVDGLAWGRGTCDMKAGVVAALAAVGALRTRGIVLSQPLAVHCVSGEEDGGVGAFATLKRGHRADAVVSGEPTSHSIIASNAGALTFELRVQGLATHGSTRTRGISAIEKFEDVHRVLRDLEKRRNTNAPSEFAHLDVAWPLSVGVVSAGDWASSVPDLLIAQGRYGVAVGETIDEAITQFEDAVATACLADSWLRDHPVSVSWPGGRFAPGSLPTGHRLLDDVATAVDDITGQRPDSYGGPYGSDLRHYAAAGIAMLQYGPGDVRYAHASDEQVPIADIVNCARVYATLALRLCTSG